MSTSGPGFTNSIPFPTLPEPQSPPPSPSYVANSFVDEPVLSSSHTIREYMEGFFERDAVSAQKRRQAPLGLPSTDQIPAYTAGMKRLLDATGGLIERSKLVVEWVKSSWYEEQPQSLEQDVREYDDRVRHLTKTKKSFQTLIELCESNSQEIWGFNEMDELWSAECRLFESIEVLTKVVINLYECTDIAHQFAESYDTGVVSRFTFETPPR
ncbi:hypothetical protein M231_07758 [Tremella mesenterica]|uniref:Uncharacterized protein n=1 Tax=Tremella mesenterica TaxID=5217 RepID=A0A4Q1BDN5_TREME|nr:uncharacterized protein TREMEDRAFT_61052 [Tremella mesenterica DSM 1558]EIW70544.1 hypothetical protein TREMEDRAFT_61052 [Tremella mesenterica DSM 1558]RXK34975.1 hypothetical protein M231_07758 [Tremella mesenterica]